MSIRHDSRHLYLRVIEHIKNEIDTGKLKEKERLPSEFELSKELGVSRATLREALRVLEEEQVIVRRHGVGTFINSKPIINSGIEQLNSVTDMIKQVGKQPGTILLNSSYQKMTKEDATKFNRPVGEEMLVIERVRTANGEPIVYCIDKIPSTILKEGYAPHCESIFEFFEKEDHVHIQFAVTVIEPLGYHEKVSPILQCEPETALLVLKQVHYASNDTPVLYSVNYFRADKFSFHVVRKRN